MISDDDVVTVRTRGSAEQLQALVSGETDIAVTAIDNLFEWIRFCPDLKLIGQVERTTPIAVYAKSEMTGLSVLEGTRFGVDALSNGFSLAAQTMLKYSDTKVEYVEVGGVRERMEALIAGDIDATLLGPPFDELAEKSGYQRIATVEELLPNYPGQGMVARSSVAASEATAEFLLALAEAAQLSHAMTAKEGIDLLASKGFDVGATSAWEARPESLSVDAEGLELLTRIRANLGLLPHGVELFSLLS